MIKLGDYNTLKIVKSVDFGLYLDGGEEGEILLPQRTRRSALWLLLRLHTPRWASL